jgi:hypothetical protein
MVRQHQRHRLAVQPLEPLLPARRSHDGELPLERKLEEPEILRLVIHAENGILAIIENAIGFRTHGALLHRG